MASYPHGDYECGKKDEVPVSLIYKLNNLYSKGLPFAGPIYTLRTNEAELVQAVLQMLQGFSSSLFYWDDDSFCPKTGIYLEHVSQTSLTCILTHFTYTATCLRLVEIFIKNVDMLSFTSPPTLRAFGNSISVWLKRLQSIALEEEKNIAESSTPTVLGLANTLSSLCSRADYLLQTVQGAIPSNYFDCQPSFPAAEIAVYILDHLYVKFTKISLVQAGEEEAYLMLLYILFGSSLPYMEGLDSWIYSGVLDDPYEELFFYANSSVAISQVEFWEKSYLLRQRCRKLPSGSSPLASEIDGELMINSKKEISKGEPGSSLGEKGRNENNIEVCPLFLKDIAKAIVSAGKSLQLIRHLPDEDSAFCGSCDDHDNDGFGNSKVGDRVNETCYGKSIQGLTLSEIFSVSLVGLIGDGNHINKYFRQEGQWEPRIANLLKSYLNQSNLGEDGDSGSASVCLKQSWFRYLVETVIHKGTVDSEHFNEDPECFINVNGGDRRVNCMDNLPFSKSFSPENPVITVCQTLLDNSRASHDKLNVSGSFNLPSLDDNGLRQAIFSGTDGTTSAPKETNYMFGFQYVESVHIRSKNDIKALELLYPFPTLLPHFQENLQITEVFPFHENSTLISRVLNWIQAVVPKATPLPVVIMQECLLVYIKKQVDYVGQHILLKLMHGWRLMDELGVLRAIYLLGSGDLLQHFLSVLFNKLDKGESWDDEFELNTVLQESVRNSADGMLLSAPDSLFVSVAKRYDSEGYEPKDTSSPLSANFKGRRNHHFGIDSLDMLKFSYKVPWPLELIANSEAINKYNQVMAFLLKVKRAKFVLDKARRWMWKGRGTPSRNHKRHWLVEQKLLHFVDGFHQYVMDRVFHNSWLELCEGMSTAGSLDEVIEVHEAYLLSIQRQCFVVPDKLWALIASRIKNILELALDFYTIQQTLSSGGAALAIKARCEMEVDRIERQFDDCIAFLLRVLSFKLNVGQFPHLADLVTRINYNYFYMSDSGNLLTVPGADAAVLKLGRPSQENPD